MSIVTRTLRVRVRDKHAKVLSRMAFEVNQVWNSIHDELHVTVETPVEAQALGMARATFDLGQIHLATVVTDTGHALIISGRGIRSEMRQMNKMHGVPAKKLSKCTKGSRKCKNPK